MAHLYADGETDPTLVLVVGRRSFCSSMHPHSVPTPPAASRRLVDQVDVVDVFLINALELSGGLFIVTLPKKWL